MSRKEGKYYKYHYAYKYWSKNCIGFKNIFQEDKRVIASKQPCKD